MKLLKQTVGITLLLTATACGTTPQMAAYNPYQQQMGGMYQQQAGMYGQQAGLYAQQTQVGGGYVQQNQAYAQQAGAYPQQQTQYTQQTGAAAYPQTATPQQAPTQSVSTQRASTTTRTAASSSTTSRSTTSKTTTRSTTAKAPATSKLSATDSLLLKARQRFEQINTFSAMINAYETHPTKGKYNATFEAQFKKPGVTRLEIKKHTNSMFVGAKLVYTAGSGKVTGRPGGALSFMKKTLPLSDDMVTSRRDYRLDQIDPLAIVSRLIRPELKPKLLGKTTVNGRSVAVLEFTGHDHFDKQITKELLGIDLQDHFVRIHEMYEGSKLVYSLKIQNLQLNANIPESQFTL